MLVVDDSSLRYKENGTEFLKNSKLLTALAKHSGVAMKEINAEELVASAPDWVKGGSVLFNTIS